MIICDGYFKYVNHHECTRTRLAESSCPRSSNSSAGRDRLFSILRTGGVEIRSMDQLQSRNADMADPLRPGGARRLLPRLDLPTPDHWVELCNKRTSTDHDIFLQIHIFTMYPHG